MPPAPRDLRRPVTVINRFTVTDDIEKFEREFREHSQYLRRQEGFQFLVTVRSVYRTDQFTHLGHWRSLEDFLAVVHDETFLAHVQRLGRMVEAEADQAVSVGRVTLRNAVVGAANVVLLHARLEGDHWEFEQNFGALTAECAKQDGFGGSDLLRSTVSPQKYLGLFWWYDAESCDRTLHSDAYAEAQRRLGEVARITPERTRHVAYERVIWDAEQP
jgi:heme-degrading monooxygenase HmoA